MIRVSRQRRKALKAKADCFTRSNNYGLNSEQTPPFQLFSHLQQWRLQRAPAGRSFDSRPEPSKPRYPEPPSKLATLTDRFLRQKLYSIHTLNLPRSQTYLQSPQKTNDIPNPNSKRSSKRYIPGIASVKTFTNTPQREALISQLSRLLDSESTLTSSALKQNNLSRHREILSTHRHELSRLRSTLLEARNRANLLSNVRNDIDAYHSSNPHQQEADYMLDERSRIDNSNNMADSVLSQAYAVNESFGLQRETLASINRRITGAASQVPGLNSLIGRISAKKRRDGIIMGSFIAFCFLMFVYFM